MPIITMTEDPLQHVGGVFQPRADQKKFVSCWAAKEGDASRVPGFKSVRDLQRPQPFGHGSNRALSGWEVFRPEGKNSENRISFNGVDIVEMVAPREDVEMMDKWQGVASRNRIEAIKAEELEKLDRMGLKEARDPENLKERLVEDDEKLPET